MADYPFTTLEPVLGTLDSDDRQLVLADIPGLIEGASEGAGLGHDFLAHVERTRLLVHVLDLAPLDGSDPAANWRRSSTSWPRTTRAWPRLPRLLALSKADLVDARGGRRGGRGVARAPGRRRAGARRPRARRGAGLEELAHELLRRVPRRGAARRPPRSAAEEELAEHRVFRPAADRGWRVEPRGEGAFRVSGVPVERLMARLDLENEEALAHIEHRLHRMGVMRALEAAGFEPGDDVEIAGVVFELDPG